MPTAAPTPCLQCHTLGPCPHRGQAQRVHRSRTWTKTSAELIEAHVRARGWTCPGWPPSGHLPHPSRDLTTHHVHPLATSGPTDKLAVLCRSENSRLGAG